MKGNWFGLAVAAVVASACGEGRAIFNVDIFSFLQGTGLEAQRYPPLPAPFLPPGFSVTVDTTPGGVNLPPGVSSSVVDTVRIAGNVNLENVTGSGSVVLEIFFSKDSTRAGLYAGTPAISIGPSAVTSGATARDTINVDLSAAFRDLFKESRLFIGIRARVTNTGATGLQGTARLTALSARVILQDKIF